MVHFNDPLHLSFFWGNYHFIITLSGSERVHFLFLQRTRFYRAGDGFMVLIIPLTSGLRRLDSDTTRRRRVLGLHMERALHQSYTCSTILLFYVQRQNKHAERTQARSTREYSRTSVLTIEHKQQQQQVSVHVILVPYSTGSKELEL